MFDKNELGVKELFFLLFMMLVTAAIVFVIFGLLKINGGYFTTIYMFVGGFLVSFTVFLIIFYNKYKSLNFLKFIKFLIIFILVFCVGDILLFLLLNTRMFSGWEITVIIAFSYVFAAISVTLSFLSEAKSRLLNRTITIKQSKKKTSKK